MTQDEGDGFEGFVAARWPALEAVALAATLDPDRARAVTASTVAALHGRWSDVVEEGAPTAAARTELLARMRTLGEAGGTAVPERLRDGVRDPSAPDDPVPGALLAALAHEPVPVRAALAAGPLWELTDEEVDRLVPNRGGLGRAGLGRARGADDDTLAAARHRLLEGHRGALAAAGAAPADHRLDIDLADLLDRLAATLPDPPDPADLVRARERGVRRRSLVVVGALAVAGVGVGGWAVASRPTTPDPVARGPRPAPSTAGPDDPAWGSVDRWPPRGALARDPGVQAMLASDAEGARLLFAGDVEDRWLVVSTDPSVDADNGFVVRAWGGPAGTAASRLTTLQLGYSWAGDTQDAVGLAVQSGRRFVLLALTRPGVREGRYSLVVRPTPGGRVDRTWTSFAVRDGVATTVLPRSPGPAARLQLGALDGPFPREMTDDDMVVGPGGFTESTVVELAAAFGVPRRSLEVERTGHVLPDDSLRDVLGERGAASAEVVVVRTPDGAVVRFASFRSGGAGGGSAEYGDAPLVIPASAVRAPYVTPLMGSDEHLKYFVTAPARAATVQLRTLSGAPLCRPTPVRGGAALPRLTTAFTGGDVRVVARAADGRVLYDDVPPPGRDVLDLFDFYDVGSGSGTYYG
ncbi:hypothetical protein KMZ32_07340 [Phycicoccus sp. MAQZ13P-2]|uniref:hypothetical protein n=1 Tax=Phycicoccus mangrovi TaxID=2840470 RepID=UPI001C000321|nr:hypothetical protein [Phycicoccus mangrovi]MBT9273883.1 hypothetical protein [Phycicoccus mangrovi]